jgi:broad specificity phosphatase PhoE
MTEIKLVRHGETEWNVGEVFRGRIDIELNKTGIRQAELLGEFLSDVKIDAIYSSPLKRALKTADIIARYHNLDVKISHGLIDFNYGQWQGLSLKEVKAKYKEFYLEWTSHPDQVIISGGESLQDIRQRVTDLISQVIIEYSGTVVLVAHRVVNKILICALLGLDNSHLWNIRQDTCGITTFVHENGRFILTSHNDTSFLKPLHKAPLNDF